MGAEGSDDASDDAGPDCSEIFATRAAIEDSLAAMDAQAEDVRARIYGACRDFAAELGAADLPAPPESITKEDAVAMCETAEQVVSARVGDGEVSFTISAASSWLTVYDWTRRSACEATCGGEAGCDPGTLASRCTPEELVGTCEGLCEGNCVATGDVALEGSGRCQGRCEGSCDDACTVLDPLDGTCQGLCSGVCTGTCDGTFVDVAAPCAGTCQGTCGTALATPGCASPLAPAPEDCGAFVMCRTACGLRSWLEAEVWASPMHLDVLVDGVADPVLDSAMERLYRRRVVESQFVGEVLLEGIYELQMSCAAWVVDIHDPYFFNRVVTCYDIEAEGEDLLPLIFYPDPLLDSMWNLDGDLYDLIAALEKVSGAI